MVGSIEQRVGALPVGDGAHVREVDLLRVAQVVDERAGGGDGGRWPLEAEALEPAGAQLIEQRRGAPLRRRTSSASTGVTGRPAAATVGAAQRRRRSTPARDDDLARPQDGDLVGERLQAVGAVVFGRGELAGREVEQRDAERRRDREPSARPTAIRNAGSRASR